MGADASRPSRSCGTRDSLAREIYNDTRMIERHGFLSPAEYRRRQLQPPLSQRRLQSDVPKTESGTILMYALELPLFHAGLPFCALNSFLSAFFIVNNEIIPPPWN